MADLEKELAEQCTIIASLEACQRVQSRCITYADTRMVMLEHDSTSLKERLKALEHPKKYGLFILASDRASVSFILSVFFKVCFCNNKPYVKMTIIIYLVSLLTPPCCE